MSIEFKIIWDGEVPGLSENSVRLGVFSEALGNLSRALQWTASAILAERSGEAVSPDYGSKGQLKSEAKSIDFNLVSITGGSAELNLVVTSELSPNSTLSFGFSGDLLAQNTIKKLADDIESEINGTPVNYSVRKFISSVPKGLTKHSYGVTINGITYKKIDCTNKNASQTTKPIAALQNFHAYFVAGFGFEPGPYQVKLKSLDGKGPVYTLEATKQQVAAAEKLRGKLVNALGIVQKGALLRLLWIKDSMIDKPLSPEERNNYITTKWGDVFKRLAE